MGTHFLEEPAAFIFGVDSSTLKMEAEDSSGMLAPIYQTTWHHILEEYTLSYIMLHNGKGGSVHMFN
jgi:hypothetical protein